MSERIGLLLVTDQMLLRQGLAALLSDNPAVELVGEARNGEEAVACYKTICPDVVLICLESPQADSLPLITALRRLQATARIVILERATAAEDLVAAIQAGALGYLLPEASLADLVKTIQTVYAGQPALSPALMPRLVEVVKRPSSNKAHSDKLLTQREFDIVRLVAQGLTNQEIADQLIISERTVRTHISHILLKLNLSNRTQLALHALRSGWTGLDGVSSET